MEWPASGCYPGEKPAVPPRNVASKWQTLLDQNVTPYFQHESYGGLTWRFKVVTNPQPQSGGWWPTQQCSKYPGSNNFVPTSLVGDAAQRILALAVVQGLITVAEIANTHNFVVMDNYDSGCCRGQSNGNQVPQLTPLTFTVPVATGPVQFITEASVVAEHNSDSLAIGVLEHELGNQLGLPELFSGGKLVHWWIQVEIRYLPKS